MEKTHHQTPPPSPPSHGPSRALTGKPRGRPAGSKNKPKQPIVIISESPSSLKSHFLEIPPDHDIVQALADFAVERQRGICILSATGSVKNVSLSHHPPEHQRHSPSLSIPGVLNFTGRFEILSLSGAFLPPPAPPPASGMSAFLSGGQGQVVGGKVSGALVTAGMVVVAVSAFAVATYERLPLVEENGEIREDEDETKIQTLTPQQQQTTMDINPAPTHIHERRAHWPEETRVWQ